MPFVWKSALRVDLAVAQAEIRHRDNEISQLKAYIAKCEHLIDHERQRVTDERERADRVNDALLQQNGLPASTATVREEQAENDKKLQDLFEKQRQDYAEIYAETLEDFNTDGDTDIVQDVTDLIGSAAQ